VSILAYEENNWLFFRYSDDVLVEVVM